MDHSPPRSSVHGILQKSPGVGYHALLQGIFLTQGLNSRLHWQAGSLPLVPAGKPMKDIPILKQKDPQGH